MNGQVYFDAISGGGNLRLIRQKGREGFCPLRHLVTDQAQQHRANVSSGVSLRLRPLGQHETLVHEVTCGVFQGREKYAGPEKALRTSANWVLTGHEAINIRSCHSLHYSYTK